MMKEEWALSERMGLFCCAEWLLVGQLPRASRLWAIGRKRFAFPRNQRWLMTIWSSLFNVDHRLHKESTSTLDS
jgi:hypothetical protein